MKKTFWAERIDRAVIAFTGARAPSARTTISTAPADKRSAGGIWGHVIGGSLVAGIFLPAMAGKWAGPIGVALYGGIVVFASAWARVRRLPRHGAPDLTPSTVLALFGLAVGAVVDGPSGALAAAAAGFGLGLALQGFIWLIKVLRKPSDESKSPAPYLQSDATLSDEAERHTTSVDTRREPPSDR